MKTKHNSFHSGLSGLLSALLISLLIAVCFTSCATAASAGDSKLIVTEVSSGDFDSSRDPDLVPWKENPVKTAIRTGTLRFYFLTGYESEGKTKGDCCLAVFPDGETMLIDAGMNTFGEKIADNLLAMGIDHLDYLLFTHAHDDHCFGVLGTSFLGMITVGKCLYNGIHNRNWSNEDLIENTMEYRNIPLEILSRGDSLDIGGVHIDVLSPSADNVGKSFPSGETNLMSIAMKLTYKDTSAMFTGDIHVENENEIIGIYGTDFLDVDFLKLAHHGLNSSNGKEFLDATTPLCAMCEGSGSISDHLYLELGKLGCTSFMDTIDGYVRIVLDGEHVTVSTSRIRNTEFYDRLDKAIALYLEKKAAETASSDNAAN